MSALSQGSLTLLHYGSTEARKWAWAIGREHIRIVTSLATLPDELSKYGTVVGRVILDATIDAADFLLLAGSIADRLEGDVVLLRDGRGFINAASANGRRVFYSMGADDVTFYLNCHGLLPNDAPRRPRATELPLATVLPPFSGTAERDGVALIADDEPRSREEAAAILRALGYPVILAKTGLQAIRLAESIKPPVVLLDGLMPEMPGFEVARFLRMQSRDYKPYVLLMTAVYKNTRYRNEAKLKYGIDSYIVKPLTANALAAAVAPAEERMRVRIPA
jgi:CheY-like chemotaxis protein